VFLCFLLSVFPASATSYSTDFSDLWYNPNENGWGVNVIQQGNTLFLTFFIYGSDNKASWYVASSVPDTTGNLVFSGALYQTTGPWFGTTFNPSAVGVKQVGTVTFTVKSIADATLSYTINSVTISKSITRQTWKIDDLTGTYIGGGSFTRTKCTNSASNGHSTQLNTYTFTPTATGLVVTLTGQATGNTCTFTGDYSQYGRLGQSSGNYTCSSGSSGTFTMTEIEATPLGLLARTIQDEKSSGCHSEGQFGGFRQ
jgi:hypothetical protein